MIAPAASEPALGRASWPPALRRLVRRRYGAEPAALEPEEFRRAADAPWPPRHPADEYARDLPPRSRHEWYC